MSITDRRLAPPGSDNKAICDLVGIAGMRKPVSTDA